MIKDAARMYRESAVRGASPVGLIVILYEEIIRAIRKAQRAIQQNDIGQRTLELNHALHVIGHLQATLNFELGGEAAQNLSQFYHVTRVKILACNVQGNQETLEWLVGEFSRYAGEWQQLDRLLNQTSSSEAAAVNAGLTAPAEDYKESRGIPADR